jgi:DNA-binding transcriptional MerR regulator
MFKIGEFSKISQVSIRSLRHYDEIGLLRPAYTDAFTGYRFYTADQLPRLNRIIALKELGLSLEEVGHVLNDNVSAREIRGMLRLKEAELRQRVREEQMRLVRVESRLRQIEEEGSMPRFEIILKKVLPKRVLSSRQVAPTLQEMGDLLYRAYFTMRQQVRDSGPGIAVFYDEMFDECDLDWELGFSVSDGYEGNVTVDNRQVFTVGELPRVDTMACTISEGSYIGLHLGYSALGRWIETNGYRITGPNREVFLHISPERPEAHITEIQFPVQPAGEAKG